nr:MAG TPA: hypothetical protein [Caudoviricetes sp.]
MTRPATGGSTCAQASSSSKRTTSPRAAARGTPSRARTSSPRPTDRRARLAPRPSRQTVGARPGCSSSARTGR